jgi:hypothetical protein
VGGQNRVLRVKILKDIVKIVRRDTHFTANRLILPAQARE